MGRMRCARDIERTRSPCLSSPSLQTCDAWLAKLDSHKEAALRACEATYGSKDKLKWFVNWRLFFMSCAELFGFADGEEWAVSHYLFEKREQSGASVVALR